MGRRKVLIASDGLPMRQVGAWALEKNERLRKYIDVSKGARAKWLGPGNAGATYTELYSGFGRGFTQEHEKGPIEEVDGSPIVALSAGRDAGTQFTEVHLGDLDSVALAAAMSRVRTGFAAVRGIEYPCEAVTAAESVARTVNPYGLHLVFLDPFSLKQLAFDVIKSLAQLRRIDIIIHISVQDLNRNLGFALQRKTDAFDLFAPGWRDVVNIKQKDILVRMQILDHWVALVKSLGLEVFTNRMELVSADRRQRSTGSRSPRATPSHTTYGTRFETCARNVGFLSDMANVSSIEWTEVTWNPVTGCSKVSQGCKHCYAERLAKRFWGDRAFTDVLVHDDRMEQPLRWRRPRTVFVNSMSDLFHEDVPDASILRIFEVMGRAAQHTFQVLTKRSERLLKLAPRLPWPTNVWMGVSVEDRRVLRRVDHLRHVPAAIRFLSCEPLIGPLDELRLDDIDWVIVGGESGPGARPMEKAWVDAIHANCRQNQVPFFFKQWGGVHKVKQGRRLHGRVYDEMPAV